MAQSHASGLPWAAPILLLGALLLLAAGVALLVLQWRRQLRLSQRHSDWLQRVIDGVDLAMYFLDPQGRVVQWSLGAERLYGYTTGEVLGRHFSILYGPDERAGRLPQDTLETAARQGRHRSSGWQVRRDGRRAQVESITEALRDGVGRLVGFSCAARDVSEALQQQQAVHEAHTALAQAQRMVALGRLSGGIAHEFNNVTHVIRTCAEFLQREGVASLQSGELLQMIRRNADRAADLSQRLLSVARGPATSAAATDVNEVVTSVAQLLRQTLAEDIGVELHLDAALSWCAIDRNELEAALLNVAVDARDAMPDGGTVELTTLEPSAPELTPELTPERVPERVPEGVPEGVPELSTPGPEAQSAAAASLPPGPSASSPEPPSLSASSAAAPGESGESGESGGSGGLAGPAERPARARRYVLVSISHWRRADTSSAAAALGADASSPGPAGAPEGTGHELGLTLIRRLIEQSQGQVRIEPHPHGATVQLYLPCRA